MRLHDVGPAAEKVGVVRCVGTAKHGRQHLDVGLTVECSRIRPAGFLAILGGPDITRAQDFSREDVKVEPATTLAKRFSYDAT